MNFTIITLIGLVLIGLTKLLTYLLGDKRRLRQLKEQRDELEQRLKRALATNDTLAISVLSLELYRVREKIRNIERK